MPVTLGIIQGVGGLAQTIFGGIQAGKAQRKLQALKTPTYESNQGIADYYNKALARYNTNPYNSTLYNQQQRNIQRGTSTALSALQDRRAGVNSIAKIFQSGNDASLNAAAAAEQQQAQALGQLGNAAQAKSADDQYAFQINKLMPFERQSAILGAKASGGNQIMNAGLTNIFGGLQTGMQGNMLQQLYGTNTTPKATSKGNVNAAGRAVGSYAGILGIPY